MAPSFSMPFPEQRPPGIRKRVLAASLASPDNIDPGAVKCCKLEEAQQQARQPSIEEVLDRDDADNFFMNTPPLDPAHILEAADRSDDSDDEGNGNSEMPHLEDVDESDESDDGAEESDEAELGKSIII